jgi:hypothetical protein
VRGETQPHSWLPVDLVALGDSQPPEPSIVGLSYPGSLAIHYGEPDNGKTLLELVICLEQIRLGRAVVWLDFEMSPVTINARLRDFGATPDEIAKFLYLAPSEPIGDPKIRADLDELSRGHNPAVVVIDAMAGGMALHALDGNKAEDVEAFYTAVANPFRTHGAAVHVIDHVTKDRESRGRWPIGSQRKLGAVDVGLSVENVQPFGRGRSGLAKLRVTKDRHGALTRPTVAELELASDPDTGRITWNLRASQPTPETDSNEWKPTRTMDAIVSHLRGCTEPVSRSAIADAIGYRKQTVLQAAGFLILDGTVKEVGRGRLQLAQRFPVPVQFPEPGTRGTVPGSPPTTREPEPGTEAQDAA